MLIFNSCSNLLHEHIHPLDAISYLSPLIIQMDDFEICDSIAVSETFSTIYQLPFFDKISKDIDEFKKGINPKVEIYRSYNLYSSWVRSSVNEHEFLYVLDLKNLEWNLEELLVPNATFQKSNYNGIPIIHLSQSISISKYENLLIFAKYSLLVEEAIQQIENGTSIRTNGLKMSNKKSTVSFLVNFEAMSKHLKPYILKENLFSIENWNWARLDLEMKDSILFNGVLSSKLTRQDMVNQSIDIDEEIWQIFPQNVAFLTALNVRDSEIPSELKEWMGSQVAKVIIGAKTNDEALYFVAKINNPSNFNKYLSKLKMIEDYVGFEIYSSKIDRLFSNEKPIFLCDMNGYAVTCQDLSVLKIWIDYYISGQVCSSDPHFMQLKNRLLFDKEIINYIDFSSFSDYVRFMIHDDKMKDVDHFLNILSMQGKMIFKTTIESNQVTISGIKEETRKAKLKMNGVVWKTKFKNEIITKPHVIQNRYENSFQIMVQDQQNVLFALNENGKEIWQKKLTSPIISDIISIDFYKDRHTQSIFNTKDKIYILDQDGNVMNGFPLKIPMNAYQGLLVVEYDNGIEFYVGCVDGKIYGYNKFGVPLDGWNPCENQGLLKSSLKHFQSDAKDFIFGINRNNEVRIYQKNGKPRFEQHFQLQDDCVAIDFDDLESKERITLMSKIGKVKVINSMGESFGIQLAKNPVIDFAYTDYIGDLRKDFLVLSENIISVFYYKENKIKKAIDKKLKANYDDVFSVDMPNLDKNYIGLFDSKKHRISILNSKGNQLPNFPIRASKPFVVADLLNTQQSILIGVFKNKIYGYRID